MNILILVLFLALGCAGPSTLVKKSLQELDSAPNVSVSTESYDSLQFQPFPGKKIQTFLFDPQHSSAIVLPSGKSFIHSFSLPNTAKISFLVRALPMGPGVVPQNQTLFYPCLLLLDKDKKPVADIDHLDLTLKGKTLTEEGIETVVKLNLASLGAKYLIVYSRPEKWGQFFTYPIPSQETPPVVQTSAWSERVLEPVEGVVSVPYAPTGRVVLGLTAI